MILEKLKAPFPEKDVEWKINQQGLKSDGTPWCKVLCYITARAVQERLDEVCGHENWRVSYEILTQGVLCTLSIKVGNEWVSKQDGAEITDIEPFKGAISSSLKRAGSAWSIGRYLYHLEESWGQIVPNKTANSHYGAIKDKLTKKIEKEFYWEPPKLPKWALPSVENETKVVDTKPAEEPKKELSKDDPWANLITTSKSHDWSMLRRLAKQNYWTLQMIKDYSNKKLRVLNSKDMTQDQFVNLVNTVTKYTFARAMEI